MIDLFEELRSVIQEREDSTVPYALCGGLAVAVYGHVRATEDIDLLIQVDDLDRAKTVLRQLGFVMDSGEIPVSHHHGVRTVIHRLGKTRGTDFISVDLMPVNETTTTAWKSRQPHELEDFSIMCVSKESLIEMKRASERPIDRDDAERLERES